MFKLYKIVQLIVVVIAMALVSSTHADVSIRTWAVDTPFIAGASAKHDGRAYKCIGTYLNSKTMEPVAGGNAHWEELDAWVAGVAYTEGDLVYFGAGPDIYLAVQDHNSAAGNDPTHATHWRKPFPSDPTVTVGGEGPSGDDYIDFVDEVGVPGNLLFYKEAGVVKKYTVYSITIVTTNPNFDANKSSIKDGTKLEHECYFGDYGDAGAPTAGEGDAFWNEYYDGYTPGVVKKAGAGNVPTSAYNCYSYSFDEYFHADTDVEFWVQAAATLTAIKAELTRIDDPAVADEAAFDTISGDRCVIWDGTHVWNIATSPAGKAATKVEWKNNSSAVYFWNHPAFNQNCGPTGKIRGGNVNADVYGNGDYEIWNKAARP